jgi:hypothetical protein
MKGARRSVEVQATVLRQGVTCRLAVRNAG